MSQNPAYTSLGTTARSEPVDNASILYPSGYNLNDNRKDKAPLVQVFDTADGDDKYSDDDYDEFGFFKGTGKPSENVTVTIKYSGGINSIVTENNTPEYDDDDTEAMASAKNKSSKTISIDKHINKKENGAIAKPKLSKSNKIDYTTRVNGTENKSLANIQDNGETVQNDSNEQNGATGTISQHDCLYDEYERFIEPTHSSDKTNTHQNVKYQSVCLATLKDPTDNGENRHSNYKAANHDNIIINGTKSKTPHTVIVHELNSDSDEPKYETLSPKNKTPIIVDIGRRNIVSPKTKTPIIVDIDRRNIVSPKTKTPIIVDIDRRNIVSPKTKTPIVVEGSSSSEDQGEDFMAYLKELRGSPIHISSESEKEPCSSHTNKNDSSRTTQLKTDTQAADNIKDEMENRSVHRIKSDVAIINGIEPEIQTSSKKRSSNDVVIISDDDDNSKEAEQSLAGFNFNSLKNDGKSRGGNGIGLHFTDFETLDTDDDEIQHVALGDEHETSPQSIRHCKNANVTSTNCSDITIDSSKRFAESEVDEGKNIEFDEQSNFDEVTVNNMEEQHNIEQESDENDDDDDAQDDTDSDDDDDDDKDDDVNKDYKTDSDKDNDDKDSDDDEANDIDDSDNDSSDQNYDCNYGSGDDNNNDGSNEEETDDDEDGEWYFTPGMRSRRSLGAETVSNYDCSEALSDIDKSSEGKRITLADFIHLPFVDTSSDEDQEVKEILTAAEIQAPIDCHFETIHVRNLDPDNIADSDSTANTELIYKQLDTSNMYPQTDLVIYNSNLEKSNLRNCIDFGVTPANVTNEQIIQNEQSTKNRVNFYVGSIPAITIDTKHCTDTNIQNVSEIITSENEHFGSIPDTTDTVSIVSLFSDSSSDYEIDNESDFESALEDEFWSNTMGTPTETTDSDLASPFGTPTVELITDSNVSKTVNDTNRNSDCDDNSDGELQSIYSISNSNNETNETLEHNNVIETGFVKQNEEKESDSELNDSDNVQDIASDDGYKDALEEPEPALLTEEGLLESENISSKPSVRNIQYCKPYIKDKTAQNEVNISKQKNQKLICKLRKTLLSKMMNQSEQNQRDQLKVAESNSENCQQEKTENEYIENQIKLDVIHELVDSKINRRENDSKTGEVVKLGSGYYLFGTGELLDLPIGPRLKKAAFDMDKDVIKPSIYFRGVPGIINNAYKMSNQKFPKLSLHTEAASHKILHACNRLATQLSPPSKAETKHGMMQHDAMQTDADTDDSSDTIDVGELLMVARDLLNLSRFDDAETSFLKLYKEIQEKPEDNNRLLLETLVGLADISIRRSRMCRSNPLEWQWLCMHAIALLQYTVEFCDSELENELDNQEVDWFQEQKQASELKCRPLEDAFLRALYNCLKTNFFDPFQSFSLPSTPVGQQPRKTSNFPLSSTMPQYLVVPGIRYRMTDQGLKKQSEDDAEIAIDWLAKFQHYCKDRLQSKDSKGVTEKILKSTKTKAEDDTESVASHGSQDSLEWDQSDLPGIEEINLDLTVNEQDSPVNDYSLEYELASCDMEKEGWDFFLHQRRNCNIQSVVQLVSDSEKCDDSEKENKSKTKDFEDMFQQEKHEKRKKYHEHRDIVSPLHAHSISLTLSRSFCRLADKLVQEEEYRKAEAVYEKILDIIDDIQDGTAGMLRFSARIMKNLGTVKSKQGKSSSGLVLLNKALHTYRDLQDEQANFEIAVALIELGNGYIVGKNHEDSVFDDVIIAICDFFEKDSGDSNTVSSSSAGSASQMSQMSQMSSSLGSNIEERNVDEAITCYTEAIRLLDRYEADEKQMDMFAKAVMRLGDCYFMDKDYDKALECFEKALGMFRENNMFGKDSLMENAHVLCMLGVSSFMLHVYPRAAAVFEMALHMVRCAYGFKRTFLNGLLQSLSGITYYKMKNYHKCVTMCYQGYETYCELFGEGMSRLDKQKFWLVCQTLYVMGNSYNILNLQQKAMKYLTIARSLMKSCKSRERRQFMRVLQILGDCYFAQYDYKTALTYYNEALEYGECDSQISFDEVFDPNCASDEMTIHNHLVSKSAEAHLSMRQYDNAVHYLEQAHDMQELMGEDIKEDLICTLNQLGHMHSVAGDVDKAIDSYKESLEVFREIHKGELGTEMCPTLGNLASACYVKACISDDPLEEHTMILAADNYFQEAMTLENNAEVCVKYGNYLYSQCYFESAIVFLKDALRNDRTNGYIVFGGIGKVTLPDLLQDEVDTQDEICLPSTCLARYLIILCYKGIHDMDEAELNLICLMEEVMDYDVPLLHSLLGYAMMEFMMFEEAAECFLTAAETEEDYQLAYENYCICLLIIVQKTLQKGIDNILHYLKKKNCVP